MPTTHLPSTRVLIATSDGTLCISNSRVVKRRADEVISILGASSFVELATQLPDSNRIPITGTLKESGESFSGFATRMSNLGGAVVIEITHPVVDLEAPVKMMVEQAEKLLLETNQNERRELTRDIIRIGRVFEELLIKSK